MSEREVRRPPWYAWALLGLLALALVHKVQPTRLQGHWLLLTPVLVLAAVLVVRRLWEASTASIMCGAIALTVFSGGWSQVGLGGLPLDRLLTVIALLQIFLRAPGAVHVPPLRLRGVHLLMGLTIIYLIGSAAVGGMLAQESTFLSVFDQFGIAPYLAFLVAPAVFSGQRERNLLLATLVGVGAYLGFTAIFESLGPHALVFPRYILSADVATPGGRAGGPFQSSLAEGCATFACAVAAAMAFAQWQGQRRRYLAAIVAVVCIFGCFLTLERGVWIAAIVATAITAMATRSGRRWLAPGLIACAIAIGGALALSPALSQKTSSRASSERSVWDRENQTAAGLRMFASKPILGFGLGRYESYSLAYFRQPADYPMTGYTLDTESQDPEAILPLHNLYLAYVVELGLVGALLWLATLFWGVGSAIFRHGPAALRPWKLGLLAISVFFLVVTAFNPLQPPFTSLLLWTWAGVALSLVKPAKSVSV
jgi:putative inorganic carbon (hco3(-)) transporter